MKFVKFVLVCFVLISSVFLLFNSCGNKPISSVEDTYFAEDGTPKDTFTLFTPTVPTSVRLYIETSGSMNGFFRATKAISLRRLFGLFFQASLRKQTTMYIPCRTEVLSILLFCFRIFVTR